MVSVITFLISLASSGLLFRRQYRLIIRRHRVKIGVTLVLIWALSLVSDKFFLYKDFEDLFQIKNSTVEGLHPNIQQTVKQNLGFDSERLVIAEIERAVNRSYSNGTNKNIEFYAKNIGRTDSFYKEIGSENYKKLEDYVLEQTKNHNAINCILFHFDSNAQKLSIQLSEKNDCSSVREYEFLLKNSDLKSNELLSWSKDLLLHVLTLSNLSDESINVNWDHISKQAKELQKILERFYLELNALYNDKKEAIKIEATGSIIFIQNKEESFVYRN
ncbi:MAG: hypothetical protein VBE63_17565 [Lamprobacter sp.]|uniref:hypothetical protein n=1 Tax=Lamprobacter sp. TaxID=3100796 RepID=UPI002B25C4F8|nr:hypothetical protein [Lamprobacter sp.]MEA3641726.1 hypothetical protein [Lamprobacter sp.]